MRSRGGCGRWLVGGLLLILVVIGGAGLAVYLNPGLRSTARTTVESAIGAWCDAQLKAIAADLLVPELTWTTFRYRYPLDVEVTEPRLALDGFVLAEAERLSIVLDGIPEQGRPLVISSVRLDRPVFNFQWANGGVTGWRTLVRNEGRTRSDGGSTRPSDVFAIRELAVTDATVSWVRGSGTPLGITGLSGTFDSDPDSATPGLYAVDLDVTRRDLLEIRIVGGLNIDDLTLSLQESRAHLSLASGSADGLTSALQEMVEQNGASGQLTVSTTGLLDLRTPTRGPLSLELDADHWRIDRGELQYGIDRMVAKGRLADQVFTLDSANGELLDGSIDGHGTIGLTPPRPFDVTVSVKNVELERLISSRDADGPPDFKGRVAVDGTFRGDADDPVDSLRGSGSGSLRNGRIVELPVFSQFATFVDKALDPSRVEGGNARADATFSIADGVMTIPEFEFVGDTIAGRGHATVHSSGRYDVRLNAGPLERVQQDLGPFGELLGKITDAFIHYRVTGVGEQAEMTVEPLGRDLH